MESRNDSNWKQTSLWPRQEKLLKEWRRLRIRLRDYKEARQSGAVGGGGGGGGCPGSVLLVGLVPWACPLKIPHRVSIGPEVGVGG